MLSINPFILFVNSSLTPTFSLRKEKVGPKETSSFFAKRKGRSKRNVHLFCEKKRVEPKETNCGAAVFIWVEKFLCRGALPFWQYGRPADISIKNLIEKYFSLDKIVLTC